MILNRSAESLSKELYAHRTDGVDKVNQMIGETRKKYITDIAGQESTYREKEEQARAYLAADPEPVDLKEYRMIQREVDATGWTPYQAAQVVLAIADQWRTLAADVEGLRRGYTVQVEAATSKAEIAALVYDLTLTLEAFNGA